MKRRAKIGVTVGGAFLGALLAGEVGLRVHDAHKYGVGFFAEPRNELKRTRRVVPFRTFGPRDHVIQVSVSLQPRCASRARSTD